MDYKEFLKTKIEIAKDSGFNISVDSINPGLNPHQKDIVMWAIKGGRRAVFASFGLGKTAIQIEFCHQVVNKYGGKALIVCPLGVKQEFKRDSVEILGYNEPEYVRTMGEVEQSKGDILLTNYERVRDGDIDPKHFTVTSLDEAAVLRSFGSKTYQTFLEKFKGVPYKMVATATPSPNKYKELIHYAGYLEITDTGNALTKFFKRDSTKANNLTLYPNMEDEFWLWMSTMALFVTKPSDIDPDYSDDGYELPPLQINWHELPIEYGKAQDKYGQISLFDDAAVGLKEAAHIKKESMDIRIQKMKEIVEQSPDDTFVLWHDREAEREKICKALPSAVAIWGSQDYDIREQRVIDFSNGKIKLFATKKSLSATGCNFQHHCHREIFVGIDYEFADFIQAIHRCYRFLQHHPVIIDVIYMENERPIKEALLKKWKQHNEMVQKMTDIVKKYGLGVADPIVAMERKMELDKLNVVDGDCFKLVNADCVQYVRQMEDNSVGMILTSIPFSNHYEYSQSVNDFGHNESTEKFFDQMDFLVPELLRVLKPGRVAMIHVKDRVLFGNVTGLGFPTMEPFHMQTTQCFMKHGFAYFGMITVTTDVVRENNQTYRLGYTEMCKDSTKMGVGCEEYLLLFRKPQTNKEKAYADEPVTHDKDEYPLSKWQLNAHGYWRSSGDRLVTPEELNGMSMSMRMKVWKEYSKTNVYSWREHVDISQGLERLGGISKMFMTLPPASNTPQVWDDIARMKTLNTAQSLKGKQMHVCLASGSLVLTKNGFKPIEKIVVGDEVLTHNGNWKPVTGVLCTGEKETIQVKAQGVPNLILTPDHNVWARTTDNYPSRPKEGMRKATPVWTEASQLGGCYVNLKLPPISKTELTKQEWWIIGRYLVDGHKDTRGDYFISVGKNKQAEFEKEADGYYGSKADRKAMQYRLLSNTMSDNMKELLDRCGSGAENKQVPIEGLCLNAEYSEALLSGYLSGDGSKTGNSVLASSVSRALLLGIAMVAQRARSVIPTIYAGRKEIESFIEGRKVHCKQEWQFGYRNGSHAFSEILEDGAWKKVMGIESTGIRTVWSIEVADDHSFMAEGCIVKNCPLQIDIIERGIDQFSNEGDVIFDPFNGVGSTTMMAIKMHRYGLGTELSTPYWKDSIGYCKDAEMDIKSPTLFDFMEDY